MKKITLLFAFLSFIQFSANAQCLPNGITFTTQAQIDNFQANYPGCTEIGGMVQISGDDINNLNGLNVITSIGDNLSISNTALTDLTGLENLNHIKQLYILNNTNLESLDGLSSLDSITHGLDIDYNGSLTNINGLSNLTYAHGSFVIVGNTLLTSISGIENVSPGSITNLNIQENISLSICEAQSVCEYLTNPIGRIEINNNAEGCNTPREVGNACGVSFDCLPYGTYYFSRQVDIDNFQVDYPLCTNLGGVVIIGGEDITNLLGLNVITSVEVGLVVNDNPLLTSLVGLENIDPSSLDYLAIGNNETLSNCDIESICNILANDDTQISIYNNAYGCNTKNQIMLDCENPDMCLSEGITFTTQSQIDNFQTDYPFCNEILGNVIISGNNITNLNGLNVLTYIGGNLKIIETNLTNFSGLENLISVSGDVTIGDYWFNTDNDYYDGGNHSLTTLTGLENLTTIGGSFSVSANNLLSNFSNLQNLDSIGENIFIWNNSSLIDLTGLENLTSVAGNIEIYENNALTSLNGLNNLVSISGSLSLGDYYLYNNDWWTDYTLDNRGNQSLTSLAGLENLQSVGHLTISSNGQLSSLSNLESLTAVEGGLHIFYNSALTDLNGLEGITSITNIYIAKNNALTSLNGLNNLNTITGSLVIGDYFIYQFMYGDMDDDYVGGEDNRGNQSLTDITALENLTAIGGTLNFQANSNLTDLSGLENITTIVGNLEIYNCSFTDLNDFVGLTSISGSLLIGGNDPWYRTWDENGNSTQHYFGKGNSLTSLSGLENLTSLGGDLSIIDNYNLTSIESLINIDPSTISDLSIYLNEFLSTCEIQTICSYLSDPNGTVEIHDNDSGCDNMSEVLIACGMEEPCLPGGILFSSQLEIDNFQSNYPGCTEIQGNVEISGDDITNLDGISYITSIGGNLNLIGNSQLNSLSDLENLSYIGGDLYIEGSEFTNNIGLQSLDSIGGSLIFTMNGNLISLNGLNNLKKINENLFIGRSDFGNSVSSLTGLDSLTFIGGSIFINSTNLTSLNGLEGLTYVPGDVHIGYADYGNDQLTSLNGLNNIDSIGGNLEIFGNPLNDLSGLESLTYVGGDLSIVQNGLSYLTGLEGLTIINGDLNIGKEDIFGNPNLINLTGLDNLTSINGNLDIEQNEALVSLTGLDNIDAASISNLSIYNNASLSTCAIQSICDYLAAPGGTINIHDNASGCNSQQEVEDACEERIYCYNEGIIFTTQAEIDDFQTTNPICTKIGGNLEITGDDITDLSGLNSLVYVGGNLVLNATPLLIQLTGLENIDSIGGDIQILNNSALASLSGLVGLTKIGGNIIIDGNTELTSITGIENIEAATINDLSIYNNTLLSTCEVESVCAYLAAPNGTVDIHDNAAGCNSYYEVVEACGFSISCLSGGITFTTQSQLDNFQTDYPGCTEINGNVVISGSNITDLTGLNVLTTLNGSLTIAGNNNLINLTGLENLTHISGSFNIGYNFEGNSNLISLSGLEGLTYIGGNLEIKNCSSLVNLIGLDSLYFLGGNLYITSNYAMTSLYGIGNLFSIGGKLEITYVSSLENLNGLDSLTSVGSYLFIGHNEELNSITGLESLKSIGGDLGISDNVSLTSLSGLEELTSIDGSLFIELNNALTSLNGVHNINSTSITGLSIYNNSSLSDCEVQNICEILATPNMTIDIHDNADGCNSLCEIATECMGIPYPPTNLIDEYVDGSYSVPLRWNPPSNGEDIPSGLDYFIIYQDSVEIATIPYQNQEINEWLTYDVEPIYSGTYIYSVSAIYDISVFGCSGNYEESEWAGPDTVIVSNSIYFTPVWSSNPFQPMNIIISDVSYEDEDFGIGDEIAVFDVDGSGNEFCVGTILILGAISEDNPLIIVAAADDPTTQEKDGFTPGNSIVYKAWRNSTQTEYTTYQVAYNPLFESVFTPFGTALAEVTFYLLATQTITFNIGWNIMSFDVEPANMNMISILNPLITSNTLIKALNETGGFVQYIPGFGWLNTIGNMATTEGYYAKLNTNSQLAIMGVPPTLPKLIPLTNGWNIMGYPLNQSQNALTALQNLTNNNQLVKVINESGQFIQYIPGLGWMNTIGNFLPGEGYYIKVNANTSVTLDEPPLGNISQNTTFPEVSIFKLPFENNPYYPMNILVTDISFNGNPSNEGDEVALMDGDLCVGAGVVSNYQGQQFVHIIAAMDDPLTEIIDGYVEGNQLSFKYLNDKFEQPINLYPNYIWGSDVFEPLGTLVCSLTDNALSVSENNAEKLYMTCYPNPTTGQLNIDYILAKDGEVQIELMDMYGNKVELIEDGPREFGAHHISYNMNILSNGIYMLRMNFKGRNGAGWLIEKVVKQ